ncbi:MAG: FecR domain-containing protein [Acidobacteriota bacterium]|jgi:hypothetical protein|nr:FecR domain-containing protein [Acidobacteriota bacterium]
MAKRRLFLSALAAAVFAAAWGFLQNGFAAPAADGSYVQLTRISFVEGKVGYQRVPDEEWAAVSVNMPLEPGDRIYTGPGGRIEVEFEEGSVLRLAENTDVEMLALDEEFVQMRMLLGTASLTVEKGVEFEVATPAAAFTTGKNGIYRFEVAPDGRSDAIVRKGELEAAADAFVRTVKSGDLIRVHPEAVGPEVMAAAGRDAWDEWNDRRAADRNAASRRHIAGDVYMGVGELDRHGRWVHVSSYGWGWVPHSVGSYWSPYSVGRWVYRPRFGWTWVSYEAWGWLPYHYGRWYRDASIGWCWFPGEGFSFRFWSPGLVAFYRGAGWVSWGALGPGDYYDVGRYHYRRGYAQYLDRMRALSVRRPGDFINRNVRDAFRTVDLDHFRRASFNERSVGVQRDIAQPWRQGELVRGRLDVTPTRDSFRPAPERQAARPTYGGAREVVVRREPTQVAGGRDRFRPVSNPGLGQEPSRQARQGQGVGGGAVAGDRSGRMGAARPVGGANADRMGNGLRGNSFAGNSFSGSTNPAGRVGAPPASNAPGASYRGRVGESGSNRPASPARNDARNNAGGAVRNPDGNSARGGDRQGGDRGTRPSPGEAGESRNRDGGAGGGFIGGDSRPTPPAATRTPSRTPDRSSTRRESTAPSTRQRTATRPTDTGRSNRTGERSVSGARTGGSAPAAGDASRSRTPRTGRTATGTATSPRTSPRTASRPSTAPARPSAPAVGEGSSSRNSTGEASAGPASRPATRPSASGNRSTSPSSPNPSSSGGQREQGVRARSSSPASGASSSGSGARSGRSGR